MSVPSFHLIAVSVADPLSIFRDPFRDGEPDWPSLITISVAATFRVDWLLDVENINFDSTLWSGV